MTTRRTAVAAAIGIVVGVGAVTFAASADATPATNARPATVHLTDPQPHPTSSLASTARPTASPAPGGVHLGGGLDTPGPTPTPTATGGAGVGGGGCGFFDVSCHVQGAITGWFKDLVRSALNPVLSLLGRSVLATPDVTGVGRVSDLWAVSAGIANGVFVLFIVAGGMLVMGHETLHSRYTLKDVLPRIVVAGIAANTSLAMAGLGIHFANAFSQAFLAGGVNANDASAVMTHMILTPLSGGGPFLILCALVVAALGVVLLCTYVARIALVVLLVAAAPVMLACLALPQTEWLGRLWFRAFIACLGIQVAQSLMFIAALRVFFTPSGSSVLGLPSAGGLVNMLVAACLLWLLIRVPAWASRMAFSRNNQQSMVTRMVKTAIIYKAIRAAAAVAAL